MPPRCTVCDLPQVATIDAVLAAGLLNQAQVARDFGLDRQAVGRHARSHRHRSSTGTAPSGQARSRAPIAGPPASVAPAAPPPAPASPVETFRAAFRDEPMAHQIAVLTGSADTLILKGRQIGMTTAAAGLALHTALSTPGTDAVIVSPSMRQSTEVTGRARLGAWELGVKLLQDSTSILRFENGSRVVSLPGKARGVRGYSAALLVIDEAAWVDDETWAAARPLTSATGGRTIVQSTGGEPTGWFYDLYVGGDDAWERMKVRSDEAPNVDPAFLERERRALADKPWVYAMEYEAEFNRVGSGLGRWFPGDEFDKRVDDRFQAIELPSLGG